MFKKSFSTVACMGATYEKLIDACLNNSMDGIEIRQGNDGSVCGISDAEGLKKLGEDFNNNGITITDLGSGSCFTGYNADAIEAAKKQIDIAEIIGTDAMRVFLGYFAKMINPDKPVPDYDGIVKTLKKVCDYAAEKNVEIWLETHNEFATGKTLKKLIADVSKDNLKVIWDIIHPIEDGETIEETWAYIGDCIAHIHIKDGLDRHDPEWHDYKYTRLGAGELPLGEIKELLRRVGYRGFLSLEWESAWRPEIANEFGCLNEILQHYNKWISA